MKLTPTNRNIEATAREKSRIMVNTHSSLVISEMNFILSIEIPFLMNMSSIIKYGQKEGCNNY